MSYVVHIWEEAAPASLQEADRLHERLAGIAAAPNPKFRQLALALIQRFPAEVGGRGEVDESWVESCPDGATDTRVYSLGLYDGGVTQLLPVLVDEANALGLTVYDDQAGCAWLPGAWVLDAEGRHVRQPEPQPTAPALTMALVKARLKAVVSPALAPHGFKMSAKQGVFTWTRRCDIGDQEVILSTRIGPFGIECVPFGFVVPTLPSGLAQAVPAGIVFSRRHSDPESMRYQDKPDAELGPFEPRRFLLADVVALEGFLRAYLSVVLTAELPLLQASREVPGLLQAYRQPERWLAQFRPDHGVLALAHWTGATDFDTLVAANRAGWQHMPAVVRTLDDIVSKLNALPEYFGSYPRMD